MLPVAKSDVLFKPLAQGAVVFSIADEVYVGLDTVWARIWELLPPVHETIEELCATLAREYPDVPLDMLHADVVGLLERLTENGLVVPRSAPHADVPSSADPQAA
jgi:hypothetical protein